MERGGPTTATLTGFVEEGVTAFRIAPASKLGTVVVETLPAFCAGFEVFEASAAGRLEATSSEHEGGGCESLGRLFAPIRLDSASFDASRRGTIKGSPRGVALDVESAC